MSQRPGVEQRVGRNWLRDLATCSTREKAQNVGNHVQVMANHRHSQSWRHGVLSWTFSLAGYRYLWKANQWRGVGLSALISGDSGEAAGSLFSLSSLGRASRTPWWRSCIRRQWSVIILGARWPFQCGRLLLREKCCLNLHNGEEAVCRNVLRVHSAIMSTSLYMRERNPTPARLSSRCGDGNLSRVLWECLEFCLVLCASVTPMSSSLSNTNGGILAECLLRP